MWRQESELRRARKSQNEQKTRCPMLTQIKVINLLSKWQQAVSWIKLFYEVFHKKKCFTRWSSVATRCVPHSQTWSADSLLASSQVQQCSISAVCLLLYPSPRNEAQDLSCWYLCWEAMATCLTGAKYFTGGMRRGKIKWLNVDQSHCEDSRTSSLSQLGSDNFIKIF